MNPPRHIRVPNDLVVKISVSEPVPRSWLGTWWPAILGITAGALTLNPILGAIFGFIGVSEALDRRSR